MLRPTVPDAGSIRGGVGAFVLHRLPLRLAVFCVTALFAAILDAAPSPTPGSVLAPVDKPVYQPAPAEAPDIEKPASSTPSVPVSSVTVPVRKFLFKGNTTYSDAVLGEVVARFEGKRLSIADIYQAADMVEIYYRYHGYLLTSVYVPAQQIDSGNILLEVIEGRLGSLRIKGTLTSYHEPFLIEQADSLRPGEIIDDASLETETLLLDDLPGLSARAVIAPGDEYGTSDVVFITDEHRYSGAIGINNYGRKSIGEKRLDAGLLIANPLWQGDQLNLSLILAEHSRMLYGRADYDILLDHAGSRAGLSYSRFRYDVDTAGLGLAPGSTLEGSGETFVLRLSHPFVRSTRSNLSVSANLRRSTTDESGSLSARPDTAINLLELFVNWDYLFHSYAKTSLTAGVITNFRSRDSLLDSASQKAKLTLDLRHYQPFLKNGFVLGHVQAAYSPDPLVDVEKFRIGGQGSVRAFPSAEIAGDKGAVLSLDVGMNIQVNGDVLLTPKLFADTGKLYRHQPVGVPDSESLSGYGAGLGIVLKQNHSLDLEVARPVTNRVSSDKRDTRFWFGYRGTF